MTVHRSIAGPSLIERAADFYDLAGPLRATAAPAAPTDPPAAAPAIVELVEPKAARARAGHVIIDRDRLAAQGFIQPETPVGALSEEMRIVKRQLLQAMAERRNDPPSRLLLICSAHPNEGKSFCALNLALSLVGEEDVEVLLVDGDVVKPELVSLLGVQDGPGLVDALGDPKIDVNDLILETDIEGLSLLRAGSRADNVTELLASDHGAAVLASLTRHHPRRVVIMDSPPALAASPASVLAGRAGEVILVARADRTSESDLRKAAALVSSAPSIRLLLNGVSLPGSARSFGSYYGYES